MSGKQKGEKGEKGKKEEKKTFGPVTREYTINIHKRTHGL